MTAFLAHPVLTTAAPMVSNDKGSFGNRINCSVAQAGNTIATGATVAGAVAGATYLNKHSDTVKKVLNSNIMKKTVNGLKKMAKYACESRIVQKFNNSAFIQKTLSYAQKAKDASSIVANGLKSLPKSGKFALAGVIALALTNGIYKSGQIDQKYTDRAKMEKNMV